jgi:hypothetical protein
MRADDYGFWLRSALWLSGALVTLLAVAGTVSAQPPEQGTQPEHGGHGHYRHGGPPGQEGEPPLGNDGQFSREGERPRHATPQPLDLTDAPRVRWAGGLGSWHDGERWDGGKPPGDAEVAVLGPGAVVTLDADAEIGGFELAAQTEDSEGATLRLPSSSLKIRGASRVAEGATLELSGGILTGPGDLDVDGTLRWLGGSMSGTGRLRVGEDGRMELTGADRKVLSLRSLDNAGHLTWSGKGSWVVTFHSKITNLPSGHLRIDSPALLDVYGPPGPTLENRGELVRAGAGTTTFETPFTNAGSVVVEEGTLALLDAFVQTGGTTRVAAGAAIESPREIEVLGGTLVGEGHFPATLKAN